MGKEQNCLSEGVSSSKWCVRKMATIVYYFLDQLKASRFWWILNDNKNNNFVLNYYVPDALLSALYILAYLVLTISIEQPLK